MKRKKKISCRAFRREKKYPAHQVARKKKLADQKSSTPPPPLKS